MKCNKCKKQMDYYEENYIRQSGNKTIIIENTPTYICGSCYEKFYTEETIKNIEEQMDSFEELSFKLLVMNYKK